MKRKKVNKIHGGYLLDCYLDYLNLFAGARVILPQR
jgi:hypothetical protein